ncbi:cysteine-rich CWC family protein [Pseudaeromonas sp. ZJS20]|uniref:cysteine-rich CWC family protein n=1 Tax=Pseudaeromonas aegiceratis TaxID=3153928 RepID=UPI00390C814C
MLHITAITPDPLRCPLCGQANGCVNLGTADVSQSCWCNDPAIRFPAALLARIPTAYRGKACVCKSCASQFQAQMNAEQAP